jgi:hypothetical protein
MRITYIPLLPLCWTALAGAAAAQPARCPCETFEASVTITIREGANNSAAVDRNRVCVARGGEVSFVSPEGDFEVHFDKGDGTPFAPATVRGRRNERAAQKASRSNNVRCGRAYRYTVRLRKDGRDLRLDPEIIIESGGAD